MRIPSNTTPSVANVRKTSKASKSGGRFALDTEELPETQAATSTKPLSGISAILAAQELNEQNHQGRRRATMRAEALLDELDTIRIGLLTGGVAQHRLQDLRQMVAARRSQTDDPKLEAILDDIDLRVQVELAKYLS